jgi:Delta3-Delta2-enoyl-CoA isomerase
VTQAFYAHPKILVAALNGPAVGLSAALVAFADFVYAAPHAFLLTPFTSLGLVAEGGASRALVLRLGVAKASEALIQSRRIGCEDLVRVGFVNEVVEAGGGAAKDGKGMDSDKFLEEVLRIVDDRMGDHLNADSMVKVKALIRAPERDVLDRQNVREVLGGLERFAAGIPQEEFRKLAMGEKRHKL